MRGNALRQDRVPMVFVHALAARIRQQQGIGRQDNFEVFEPDGFCKPDPAEATRTSFRAI